MTTSSTRPFRRRRPAGERRSSACATTRSRRAARGRSRRCAGRRPRPAVSAWTGPGRASPAPPARGSAAAGQDRGDAGRRPAGELRCDGGGPALQVGDRSAAFWRRRSPRGRVAGGHLAAAASAATAAGAASAGGSAAACGRGRGGRGDRALVAARAVGSGGRGSMGERARRFGRPEARDPDRHARGTLSLRARPRPARPAPVVTTSCSAKRISGGMWSARDTTTPTTRCTRSRLAAPDATNASNAISPSRPLLRDTEGDAEP